MTTNLDQRLAALTPEQRQILLQKIGQKTAQKTGESVKKRTIALPESDAWDLDQEATLDPRIQPAAGIGTYVTQATAVFVTGATGFVGAFLLDELLRQSRATLYCLVRARTVDDGKQRLIRILESYGLWDPIYRDRLVPVLGDLGQPNLGMTPETFAEMAETIEVIYHSGALLNFIFPYPAFKAINVSGTQEVLRLATQGTRKTLHYMSSFAVCESDAYANKVVDESNLCDRHDGMFLGYSQSKWVAEQLVLKAIAQGLPGVVYRLPFVTGDSETGAWNQADFFCRMVKGCAQMGCAPRLDYLFTFAPVNYISKAVYYLAKQPTSEGKIFHLQNPNPVPYSAMEDWGARWRTSFRYLSLADWLKELQQVSNTAHPLFSLKPLFLEPHPQSDKTTLELYAQTVEEPILHCEQTLAALQGSGITCPQIDTLLYTYCAYFLRGGLLGNSFGQSAVRLFWGVFYAHRLQRRTQKVWQEWRSGFHWAEVTA